MKTKLIAVFLVAVACLFGSAPRVSAQTDKGPIPAVYDIDSLLQQYPLEKGQAFRTDMIAWDSTSSVHLTQIDTGVEPNHHATHDETIWIIRGAGRFTLGDQKLKVKAGEFVRIPRGISQSFHNLGSNPAVVINVFSPGFDGKDRIYEDKTGK
jgi:mannose-6-phosphate isomerase-like protein (cupin superfamily)